MKKSELTVYRERAILVGTMEESPRSLRGEPLEELEGLAKTVGAEIVGKVIQRRDLPAAATFIGSGKVGEVKELVSAMEADAVIFDNDLSPAQAKNLEEELGVKVIDRTELILDIFATHAQTLQAKLQVELAQLQYTLPRLRRMWTHLSRQEGGIGLRGPGERQLEVDRRSARDRIADLTQKIGEIEKRKQREVGGRTDAFRVAIVGYTNAGKSTLMNTLTGAETLTEDKLFSTLDTKTRIWKLSSGMKVLISDTVGFIKNLPHQLVSSFHATLEEVTDANLLFHVVDISHPDAREQIESVDLVLAEIGCSQKETIVIFNKADKLTDLTELTIAQRRYPDGIAISALNRTGLDALERGVEESVHRSMILLDLKIPAGEGKILAELAGSGRIQAQEYIDGIVSIRAYVPRRELYRYAPYLAPIDGECSKTS